MNCPRYYGKLFVAASVIVNNMLSFKKRNIACYVTSEGEENPLIKLVGDMLQEEVSHKLHYKIIKEATKITLVRQVGDEMRACTLNCYRITC